MMIARWQIDARFGHKQTVIDIEDGPQVLDPTRKPARVRLLPGLNVFRFQDRDQSRGETSYTYKAAFSPEVKIDGDRVANNRADAAVVARGQRRVLFLDQADREAASSHQFLLQRLRQARIQMVGPQQAVGDAVEGADPHAALRAA